MHGFVEIGYKKRASPANLRRDGQPKEAQLRRSLSFLWVIDFDYATRLHHGGVIRFVNYSRELLLRGHQVYIAGFFKTGHREESLRWFESLQEQGIISGFFELAYSPPQKPYRTAHRILHAGAGNWLLREYQAETARAVDALLEKLHIDILITSSRRLLFLTVRVKHKPWIIDFCDCASLYQARELQKFLHLHDYRQALRTLKYLVYTAGEDRYYARRSTASMVVSPVDQQALARISGGGEKIFTLLNGVALPATSGRVEKIPYRLIFSGNMDFPPNTTAALWFLDQVFPLVLQQVPEAHLVLAGANPPEVLKQRAAQNVAVTGYVEDLNSEIAKSALYLAPLKTGSGFKNKIVEAVANHTYLVATSVAVEFLDSYTRSLIPVADSPQEMAALIVKLLHDPAACEAGLAKLYAHISENFTWSKRTDELLEIVEKSVGAISTEPRTAKA